MNKLSPSIYFLIFKVLGFSLLFAVWLKDGSASGFLFILLLFTMSMLRMRVPKLNFTVIVDILVCIALFNILEYSSYAFILALFQAMYLGIYLVLLALVYSFFIFEPAIFIILTLSTLCGFFLKLSNNEVIEKFKIRDKSAERYYELESLQNDLNIALTKVERMTTVAERARISRDIHDNAGHDIVAAYISLQTARSMFEGAGLDALELYDLALARLDAGVNKMREAVHNMSSVSAIGVEGVKSICEHFPACNVVFKVYGDTSIVPIYVWLVLESCLNESLTNIARHSTAKTANVSLDVTSHIVRLCIENTYSNIVGEPMGIGLRNLRQRASVIGGNLSVEAGDVFRVICVIPIHKGGYR